MSVWSLWRIPWNNAEGTFLLQINFNQFFNDSSEDYNYQFS